MTQAENYKRIADTLNSEIPEGGFGKYTLVCNGDLGGVIVWPIKVYRAYTKGYAQYNDGICIEFVKKGCQRCYGINFYGSKSFAIFRGWCVSGYNQPSSFLCFDKNIFYQTVDQMDGEKLGEDSERLYAVERMAKSKVYKVITMNSDHRMTEAVYESVDDMTREYEQTGEHRARSTRIELQGAPVLAGLCGPMYDGEDEHGRVVIRYEEQAVYDTLSA